MKKLFAILLAVAMLMGLALTASAAETNLPDLDGTGWWAAHTAGVEITETEVEISFKNTTYADAVNNWNGPLWVLYTGDEAKVNGAGYAEYWVQRGDMYGWAGAALGAANTNEADNMAALGVTFTRTTEPNWDTFVADLQAGSDCKVVAKRDGANIVVTFTVNGGVSTVTVPFPADKPAYLSLTAELAKLTNIVVKTADPVDPEPEPEPEPEPDPTPVDPENPVAGDPISTVFALLAVSAAGIAVAAKKKEF